MANQMRQMFRLGINVFLLCRRHFVGFVFGLFVAAFFSQLYSPPNETIDVNPEGPVDHALLNLDLIGALNNFKDSNRLWNPPSEENSDLLGIPSNLGGDSRKSPNGLFGHNLPNRENRSKAKRILCWIVTSPQNKAKAQMVKATWGKRCDKLIFMSSKEDASLPAIGLPIVNESRDQLWNKAKLTIKHIYTHHLNDFDWFLKADDDTYVLMENVRHFLESFNASHPLFLGHEFDYNGAASFLSGGAGYILTRESIRRLVEKGFDENVCPTNFRGEEDDVTITQCMYRVGAIVPDTRDSLGHHRFLSCNVQQFYNGKVGPEICHSENKANLNCLSSQPISFHYVSGNEMRAYEYLIYQTKVAGRLNGDAIE